MSKSKSALSIAAFAFASAMVTSAPAAAYTGRGIGNITRLEAFSGARFQLSVAAGSCAAGQWLTMEAGWAGVNADKAKNGQDIALAAFLSGKRVDVYVANDCHIEFLHILND